MDKGKIFHNLCHRLTHGIDLRRSPHTWRENNQTMNLEITNLLNCKQPAIGFHASLQPQLGPNSYSNTVGKVKQMLVDRKWDG